MHLDLRQRDRHRWRLDNRANPDRCRPPASQVAPAALASTFVTSVAGVVTFTILSAQTRGSVAPNWPTGVARGVGGVLGSYMGARLQSRLPDLLIRRLLGILEIAIAIRFLFAGVA
jgi:uncharacterized protein